MSVDQSAIQLMPLPELWPPLDQALLDQALLDQVPTASEPPGYAQPLPLDEGPEIPRQFAVLLAEVLAGVRPVRHVTPWLSMRGSIHLRRLMPLSASGHQPRVLRVLAMRPTPKVVEMTVVVVIGHRTRALAIRFEHSAQPARWQCTDIESA